MTQQTKSQEYDSDSPESFSFEKKKLDELDEQRGPVLDLTENELRAEIRGWLSGKKSKCWNSIPTNKGLLRNPAILEDGRVTAESSHSEIEILQAIVYIERWKAARRSAGSKRAAITRKNNKHALEYFSEKLAEAKLLSEDGSTIELDNLRAVIECTDRGPI
jgi:hypothetical protein